jgi:ParB family chromosome partitioning protein
VEASEAQGLFEAEARAVAKLLAPAFKSEEEENDMEDLSVAGQGYGDDELTARVFARLLKLKDAEVVWIAAFVMAETLASGSSVTDTFGILAKVESRAHWTPDEAFIDLMRNRASINGMLAQLSGKKAANKLVSAKLKEQKAALATSAPSTTWCVGWMAFPAIV